MAELRIGLIGAGNIGLYLAPLIREAGEVKLVAAADVSEEARGRALAQAGFERAYAKYEDMLSRERLDGVIVATPHHLLRAPCLAAIAAGCQVFVEKPMALNQREGVEVVAAAQARGTKLMVG